MERETLGTKAAFSCKKVLSAASYESRPVLEYDWATIIIITWTRSCFRSGVRRNFERVAAVAATLGNVPQLVSAADLADQGPDEKAMLLYTAFLCSRLMEVSAEDRAVGILQAAWRTHRLRVPGAGMHHTISHLWTGTTRYRTCKNAYKAFRKELPHNVL